MVGLNLVRKEIITIFLMLVFTCGHIYALNWKIPQKNSNSHYVIGSISQLKLANGPERSQFVSCTHSLSANLLTATVRVCRSGMWLVYPPLLYTKQGYAHSRSGNCLIFEGLGKIMGYRPKMQTGYRPLILWIRGTEHRHKKNTVAFISFLLGGTASLAVFLYVLHVRQTADNAEQPLTSKLEQSHWFKAARFGYYTINDGGFFIEMNDTLLHWLGYERGEVINKIKITDLLDPTDRPVYTRLMERGGASAFDDSQFIFLKKDGVAFPVALHSVAQISATNGNDASVIVINNRERKFALEEVLLLNQELESFSYSISHDLRAPLRSIDGYARILREDYGDKVDAEGERVIQVILNNAKRMGELIDNLLLYSRLGRKELLKGMTDMDAIVRAIVAEQLDQEKKNNRVIDVKIHKLHSAVVDVEMIKQVWTNLIANAVKFTSKTAHPKIEINAEVFPNEIRYMVKDNGVGFDMQYVEKLFGVFQRLHKVQEFAGTGVGLAIVKRIINRHHGRIWANAVIDEGATFYFTIPLENGK
jgi:PAS domain S-box-containing protein